MTPTTRATLRMVLSAVQAGVIAAGGVLLAAPSFETRTLVIAAVTGAIAFAQNVQAYLAELPPVER